MDAHAQLSNDSDYAKALIIECLRERPQTQAELQGRLLNTVTWRAFQKSFVELAINSEIVLSKGQHAYTDVWTVAAPLDLTMRPRIDGEPA